MKLLFEPRDLWVGVYWDRKPFFAHADVISIYVVLIPTLVLRFQRFVSPRKERCCDTCGWAGTDCICGNGQHRHQPIITDLKHAADMLEILKMDRICGNGQHRHQPIITDLKHEADMLEILKMDRFKALCVRLREHAQKLWKEKP